MSKQTPPVPVHPTSFQHFPPQRITGLTQAEAERRAAQGQHNPPPKRLTRSVPGIFFHNIFTLFNLINVVLAVLILWAGHPKNVLFLGVALTNTAMGIFQELRAKKTLDQLAILACAPAVAVRDGSAWEICQEDIVLGDVLCYARGDQIFTDGEVLQAEGLEVDESLLTGESTARQKREGDSVLSGSFVTAGVAYVRVTAVGRDNYATALAMEARREKKNPSQLMRTLRGIIRVLTVVIVPLGLLMFYTQWQKGGSVNDAILGASAAMLGMIPEGLVLLTGLTMTLGALTLARKKALVQSLPSIETLARVDVLCLDKTGTITDGTQTFEGVAALRDLTETEAGQVVAELMAALADDGATTRALRDAFPGGGAWTATHRIPFSSQRKWSAVGFEGRGSFALGAPTFLFPDFARRPEAAVAAQYTGQGSRVLCLASSETPLAADAPLPEGLRLRGLLVLSDHIRPEAAETFRYFTGEGVTLKVISGDEAETARVIAQRAGLPGTERCVDMSRVAEDADLHGLAEEYNVFGRVSPHAKRALIRALQDNGHTACMTGDGVNDVLALKEAACGVAMVGGSDAARRASDFVLMTSDFSAMIQVLREGRRVINNIQRVSALYLVKTIYSALLSLLYLFLPFAYPFTPIALTPISSLTVGIPSFFLALRANYHKPSARLVPYLLTHSLAAALAVVLHILGIQLVGARLGLSQEDLMLCFVVVTGVIGFMLLWQVARPHNGMTQVLIALLILAFAVFLHFFRELVGVGGLFSTAIRLYGPMLVTAPLLYLGLQRLIGALVVQYEKRKKKKSA